MKFRLNILLALAAVGIAFSAATAQAVIIVGLNQDSYADREQVATYNSTTHKYTAVTPGTIAVGDHLYGISATTVETGQTNPTVTTVFDLVAAKIINPMTGASIGAGYTGTAEVLFTTENALLSSGETGGFLTGSTGTTYTLADGSTIGGLAQASNTLNAIYDFGSTLSGKSGSLDSYATQAIGVTNATNGTLYGDFGLGAALTDSSANSNWGAAGTGYWAADVQFINGIGQTGTIPFVFGLTALTPPPATSYVGLLNELIPLQIGGEKTGTDGTNIFNNNGVTPLGPPAVTATSPVTFTYVGGGHASLNTNAPPFGTSVWPNSSADPTWIDPKTPEPGTMLMVGMGLAFGLPYVRRRRKAAA